MDTPEDREIKLAVRQGVKLNGHTSAIYEENNDISLKDSQEGQYYHKAFWKSYKGTIQGMFGGLAVGGGVGTVIGIAVALTLPVVGIAVTSIGAIVAGCAAAGMLFGAHEFGDVGKVTGAIASANETAEERMKEFENGKFAELKGQIADLKQNLSTGKSPSAGAGVSSSARVTVISRQQQNSSINPQGGSNQHCDGDHCPPVEKSPVMFWKIAAIGLAVGLAAGAVLALGGGAAAIIGALNITGLAPAAINTAAIIGMGAIGASFGINRDIFREVFDKTDLLFKGVIGKQPDAEPQKQVQVQVAKSVSVSTSKNISNASSRSASTSPVATTVEYEGALDYPTSNTHYRDRVVAAAEKALLNFDHSRATPH